MNVVKGIRVEFCTSLLYMLAILFLWEQLFGSNSNKEEQLCLHEWIHTEGVPEIGVEDEGVWAMGLALLPCEPWMLLLIGGG